MRVCPKCRSVAGPFYPSQPSPRAWCQACCKSAAAQRYATHGATINAARLQARLAAVQALAPEQRTRRQQLQVLRATCPPGQKVCSYCFAACPRTAFRRNAQSPEGVDYYCSGCRQMLDRARARRRRAVKA